MDIASVVPIEEFTLLEQYVLTYKTKKEQAMNQALMLASKELTDLLQQAYAKQLQYPEEETEYVPVDFHNVEERKIIV